MRRLIIVAVLLGAACGGCASLQGGPCSELELAAIAERCRNKVRAECPRDEHGPDESCPVLQECDAEIDAWEARCGVAD